MGRDGVSGWGPFAAAWAAFLLTHLVPARPALRAWLVGRLGRRTWFAIYGAVSLLATAWLVAAAGSAPYRELWPQLPWTRWVPNLLMPVALALAVLGLPAATATLGGPRRPTLDPCQPGLAAVTRHPLLWALALWAIGHLLPNGDLAHGLLFGGFAAMALLAMPAFDARARRALGADAAAYFAATAVLSARPLAQAGFWRGTVRLRAGRLLLALAIWEALLGLHPWVLGVSPRPL